MKTVVDIFFHFLENFIGNPIVLFFIVFIASELCFSYLKPFLLKSRYMRFEQKAISAAINGVCLVILTLHWGVSSPVLLLTLSPVMIILEVILMSRDRPFTYIYMLIKLLVNFICVYWMIVSLIGVISAEYLVGQIVFPLTLFVCAILIYIMENNSRYPTKELKLMMHRKSIGFVHFSFLTGCVISLFFSSIVLRPIIVDDLMTIGGVSRIQKMFFIEMFLKTSLVFSSSYLLLFLQARELRQKENVKALSLDLEKEEDFRKSTQQEAYVSFYVNATADQIHEGRDLFTPFMWHDINNYAEMLQKMAFFCVHQEDLTEFVSLNTLAVIEEKLERGISTGKQRLRVQAKAMTELFNLPPMIKEMYENTQEEWVWIKTRYVYTKDSESQDIYIYVSISDINEKMKKSQQLVLNATIDKLTGIYNRAALQSMIEEKLLKAKEEGESPGTMILLDVDNFKSVNDKLGHPIGDIALQEVADSLKGIFRSNDILGRLGGDEFCVFMQGAIPESIIKNRLKQINACCRRDYPVEGEEAIHVSVSIGAVICDTSMTEYEQIYQLADEALYHTKENGKNSYTLYSDLKK